MYNAAEETEKPGESMAKGTKQKRTRSIIWGIASGLMTVLMLMTLLVILDGRHNEIVLLGEESLVLEYGESFEDPGVEIREVGRVFPTTKEPEIVAPINEFDPTQLGLQRLEYLIVDNGREHRLYRDITVVDTQKPVIELLPIQEGQEPSWMRGYIEPGFTAEDNVDGDMTNDVEVTVLDDRVVYSVTDSSGNEAVVERALPAGLDAPAIELTGGEDFTMQACMSWEDPGFTVTDGQGSDLSQYVTVDGSVTPYRSGEYELVYTLTNFAGESVTATRHVTVEPVVQSDTVYPERKTIYLTFDDGPSYYTPHLLDILAKYNVKVTFFITGNHPDYVDCIGRAYREGHSIGVHSYTHNYWNIYASEEAYFDDFNLCEDLIYEQTGEYTKLFRFPGGSSNTVSNFNPGIMSRLTKTMTDMGYYYFDWNVTSGDAGETTDTDQVYWNVISSCTSNVSVVLQHDIKGFSVDAVERIIVWGLNNGYQFLPLEESSYGAHHRINN